MFIDIDRRPRRENIYNWVSNLHAGIKSSSFQCTIAKLYRRSTGTTDKNSFTESNGGRDQRGQKNQHNASLTKLDLRDKTAVTCIVGCEVLQRMQVIDRMSSVILSKYIIQNCGRLSCYSIRMTVIVIYQGMPKRSCCVAVILIKFMTFSVLVGG